MRSLRARLVAGLLALAAVGLVALAGITYAEQRSFLVERVDDQLDAVGDSAAYEIPLGDEDLEPVVEEIVAPPGTFTTDADGRQRIEFAGLVKDASSARLLLLRRVNP